MPESRTEPGTQEGNIQKARQWMLDQLVDTTLVVAVKAIASVFTFLLFTVWALLSGTKGWIAGLAGLAAAALALLILTLLQRLSEKYQRLLRGALVVVGLGAGWFAIDQMQEYVSEYRELKRESASWLGKKPEDETHNSTILDLQKANGQLASDLSDARIANGILQAQLTTATTALSTSQSLVTSAQSQNSDLQQQLARSKQPPAVVTAGNSVVNQGKMNLLAKALGDGQSLLNRAPRKDSPDIAIKPWVDATSKWYGDLLALLKNQCTPQSSAVLQNRAGRPGMSYPGVHSNEEAQSTFHGMTIILSNLASVVQRPEMCP